MATGIGLYFYHVRELVASMLLFSTVFFLLSLVVLSVLFVCYAGKQFVVWSRPVSQDAIKLFRSLAFDARR